ncbi:MAG: hypothetical protein AAFR51_14335 [Pseudomonadota bacterium]
MNTRSAVALSLTFGLVAALAGCVSVDGDASAPGRSWGHSVTSNSHAPSCTEAKQVAELIAEQTGIWTITPDLKNCYDTGFLTNVAFSRLIHKKSN